MVHTDDLRARGAVTTAHRAVAVALDVDTAWQQGHSAICAYQGHPRRAPRPLLTPMVAPTRGQLPCLLATLGEPDQGSTSHKAMPAALATINNILRDSITHDGPYSQATGPSAGGACYNCAAWYAPYTPHCRRCHSVATLTLTSPSTSQLSWCHDFSRNVLARYSGLLTLRLIHPVIALHLIHALHSWLVHLSIVTSGICQSTHYHLSPSSTPAA